MFSEEQWEYRGKCKWCGAALWVKGWGVGEKYMWRDEGYDCLHQLEDDKEE